MPNTEHTEQIRNFVTEGYRNILRREPDSGSLSFHVHLIQTGTISKEQFLNALRNSEESIRNFVTEGYRNILRREPDSQGLSNHIHLIQTNTISKEQFLSLLENSEESIQKVGHDKINFFENFPRNTGYGILGNNIFNALKTKKYEIEHFNNFNTNTSRSFISIILSTPSSFFRAKSKITIGYTMFEASRIPSSWVYGCNIVDRLFVPVKSNIDAFKSSGVNVPIDVIPIGINTDIYNPFITGKNFNFGNEIINKAYKFLVVNDGQPRKNNQMIIDAFHQEFNKEIESNNVYLIFRTHNLQQGRNIHWINRYLEDNEMTLFINSCDCMISISSGECGDIPILEGMSMQKPVIVSKGFVHDDTIENNRNGFFVETERLVPAFMQPFYKPYEAIGLRDAIWVLPSFDDLKKKMRYVYEHKKETEEVGKYAREYMLQNRSLYKMADNIEKVLNTLQ